jgi:hypothetical protein
MHTVTITKTTKPTRPGEEVKTRSFQAILHSYIEADALWSGGQTQTDKIRPVWARFIGPETSLRAFAANLREGRIAEHRKETGYNHRVEDKYEFVRSAGYDYIWQRTDHGAVLTLALPDVLSLDPGMIDQHHIQFVLLTPRWYIEQHGEVAQAQRFLTYLRNRTRRPVITTSAFAAFLLDRALDEKVAMTYDKQARCIAHGDLDDLLPPLFVNATQSRMDEFLANAVQAWFNVGAERIAA